MGQAISGFDQLEVIRPAEKMRNQPVSHQALGLKAPSKFVPIEQA
jgi:hypothetical protein